MDKERAKFILGSFRPDGADADDRDFAEALELAVRDRDLGGWLAAERMLDAEFSRALANVEPPAGLRENITRALAGVGSGDDGVRLEDALDGSMAGALGSLRPPTELRERVLVAMERTALDQGVRRAGTVWWRRAGIPLAAAAGIAMAFLLTRSPEPERGASRGPVPLEVLQAGFMESYDSPFFRLQFKREGIAELVSYLRENDLPCPGCLPEGLQKIPGIGCRELVIDGKRGSVICFDTRDQGVVHLVVFRRSDVGGDLPPAEAPEFSEQQGWATARWADGGRAFLLLGHTSAANLAGLL